MTNTDGLPSPKIGVVVIGRNERPRLDLCFASIPAGIPVVYADSDSSDGSADFAESLGIEVVRLKPDRQMTAARGRNAGARRLLESIPDIDFIQFVDGDCEFQDGWIEEAARFLSRRDDVAVVCGQRRERHPDASIYNLLCHREWNTPVGEADSSGGDSMVRAAAFRQVDGFRDEQLAHEEPEMCARLRERGWKVWRIDHPMTEHDAAIFRLSQFYRRSMRGGAGIGQVVTRPNSPKDAAARGMFRRAVIWGVAIPLVALLSLLIDWRAALAVLALYPLQWARLALRARRQGFSLVEAGQVSALSILSKFAEAQGILTFLLRYRKGRRQAELTY